jgi:ribosomal peptide maturation radical SAM protein 1
MSRTPDQIPPPETRPAPRRLPLVGDPTPLPEGHRAVGKAATVLLVCMPYHHTNVSSLSIALLSTVLKRHGIPSHEAYLHFEFARLLGQARYVSASEGGDRNSILCELLFAEHFRGGSTDAEIDRALEPLFGPSAERRALMDAYASFCLDQLAQVPHDLLAFSASFSQLFPSLWLARLAKRQRPATRVVVGGSQCSDPMGRRVSEHFPEVDVVVDGYGESVLVDLALGQVRPDARLLESHAPVDLNALPIPDYEPYLRARQASSQEPNGFMLAFESSRGCWWGAKHHCTFCGFNQLEMAFNAKSSERVITEVRTLWERHGAGLFATDAILSRAHLKEVLPRLAEFEDKPLIFYDLKANMTRREVATLRDANVRLIQPGIESLSTSMLRLMKKGVRASQNLALLKWCREDGIRPLWNLLCSIPGESESDYEEQIELIDRIPHFPPPLGVGPIHIDRYAPYFTRHGDFGWARLDPLPEYRLLYPEVDDSTLHDLAYYFRGDGGPPLPRARAVRLQDAVRRWITRHDNGDGLYWDQANGLISMQDGEASVFEGDERFDAVVARSHDAVNVDRLMADTGANEDMIAELVDIGVLWRDGDQVINLAVTVPNQ